MTWNTSEFYFYVCKVSVYFSQCVAPLKRESMSVVHMYSIFPVVMLIAPFCLFWKGIELEIVNICEKNNGGCSHHCEPAIGGAHCSCNHGHQLDTDGKTCIGNCWQLPSSCKVSLDPFSTFMLKHIVTSWATPQPSDWEVLLTISLTTYI